MSHERDYDCCQRKGCDRPAMIGSPWDMDYCTPECRSRDYQDAAHEAEHERIAEITSGGQI